MKKEILQTLARFFARKIGVLMADGFRMGGVFHVECLDSNGKLKWRDTAENIVVDTGINHILGVQFHSDTQIANGAWFAGLWSSGTAPVAGDTLASHGFTEFTTYTGTRKACTFAAAGSKQIVMSSAASFAITGTATIAGAFLCTVTSGTSGTLFCGAVFTQGNKAVSNGDTINLTYTVTGADDGV